ncbi:MAG: HD domain-containing phosphohydrolase [Desulfitobacterium sp.]
MQIAIKTPQDIIFREIELKKNSLENEVRNYIVKLESLNRSQAALINSLQELVFVLDDQLTIIEFHYPESDVLYLQPEDFLNKHYDEIGFPEPAKSTIKESIEATLQYGKPSRAEYYLDLHEGRGWYDIQVSIILGDKVTKNKLLCTIRDITERRKMEEIIFNEKEQFKATLLSIGEGVIATDVCGNILVMNNIAEKLTAWNREEALGKSLGEVFQVIHEITREKCSNPVQKVLETAGIFKMSGYTLLLSKANTETPIEVSAAPIRSSTGKATGIVIVFRDITEKREKQRQIEYLSFHDSLTGLYNRRYISEILKQLDTEENLPLALIFIDVNGLKLSNDAFGHQAGDQLLRTVAKVMQGACRAGDIIGRLGGDEFAIVLPRTNETIAKEIQEKIVSTASQITLDSVIVSLAAGCAVKTRSDQDIDGIITNAENNMYKNKRHSGKSMRSHTIETVLRNINLKYDSEQIHTERVSEYCEAIARAMNLREKEIRDIKTAGSLHDIGKITLPADILNKPSKLTDEEYEIIKKHSETGYQMLRSVDEYVSLAEPVLYHHERWDGEGYPCGLTGEDIPLASRIISVADVYEAMTAKRPYQRTKNKEEAIAELKRCAGTQFDPEIVKVFIEKVL